MKVTRDVIADLWAVYESGEASADTRALVEDFLKQDPEFARLVREERSLKMLDVTPALPSDHEKVTLEKTKQLMRYRGLALSAGFFFILFTAIVRQYRPMMLTLAALCWGTWFLLWLRLRVKGL